MSKASTGSTERRWPRRLALAALAGCAVVGVLLAAVVARPVLLVLPLNRVLGEDSPVRVSWADARLYMPRGLFHPRRWYWQIDDFAIVSHLDGTPSMVADHLYVRMPSPRESWSRGAVVVPKGVADGLTIVAWQEEPPPPFEEQRLRFWGFWFEQVLARDFCLINHDPSGIVVVIDDVDGQMQDFAYHFGRRLMVGHGDASRGTVQIGPFVARNVAARPLSFDQTRMWAQGRGMVAGQAAEVLFVIDGLFRANARIHTEFKLVDAALRPLVAEVVGDGGSAVSGRVWASAVVQTRPPGPADVFVDFQVRELSVPLKDEAHGIVVAALKVAPFVRLEHRVIHAYPVSGRIEVLGGSFEFPEVRYRPPLSTGVVSGWLREKRLHAKLHFHPDLRSGAIEWGLVAEGPLSDPTIRLARPAVLESWSYDEVLTLEELRQEVKKDRQERRAERREERRAGKHEAAEGAP